MELQTIKDSQKSILERIDATHGGDREDNATLDEITNLTTQEKFDHDETNLQDKAYHRRKVTFKLLDLQNTSNIFKKLSNKTHLLKQ